MTRPIPPVHGPDRAAALAQYRQRAAIYDWELAVFEPIRRAAIARLALRPGDTVLDLGCGTGLSLPMLCEAVGPGGHVIGIEQSPEMIALAHQRVAAQGLSQVALTCAPVELAVVRGRANAALFHFTHDVLLRPEAVDHVLHHLKPGARVVASGLKWAAPWPFWPVNLFVWSAARYSVTSLDGLDAPWASLQARLGPLQVEPWLMGGAYVASAIYRGA